MTEVARSTPSASSTPSTSATPALERSPRPQARPEARPTAAPSESPRPLARPSDRTTLTPASERQEPAGLSELLRGLQDHQGPTSTGQAIAARAESLVGTQFRPDESAQCAAFVSDVIGGSGASPEGFRATVRARDFGAMGAQRIESMQDLQPGDIVAFNDTWRFSQNEGDHTHVGVYAGDGQFIHRPTQSAGYVLGSAEGEVIREDMQAYIDRDRGRFQASFAGAYRFD